MSFLCYFNIFITFGEKVAFAVIFLTNNYISFKIKYVLYILTYILEYVMVK
jgi:hypothetical protein